MEDIDPPEPIPEDQTYSKSNQIKSSSGPYKSKLKSENRRPNKLVFSVECICNAWFSFELVMRFLASPDKRRFLREGVNVIDVLATTDFYITVIQRLINIRGFYKDVLDVLSIIRVLRIIKLTRHHPGLKILQLTLSASARELFLLILFLIFGVVIFSAMVYFAEKMERKASSHSHQDANDFNSIIDGFWWSVVTMTTVGYGDMVPKSYSGMLVGMLCALAGVLTTSLPIPVIVSNFTIFYQHMEARKKLPAKRQRVLPAPPEKPQRASGVLGSKIHLQGLKEQANKVRRAGRDMSAKGATLIGRPSIIPSMKIGLNTPTRRDRKGSHASSLMSPELKRHSQASLPSTHPLLLSPHPNPNFEPDIIANRKRHHSISGALKFYSTTCRSSNLSLSSKPMQKTSSEVSTLPLSDKSLDSRRASETENTVLEEEINELISESENESSSHNMPSAEPISAQKFIPKRNPHSEGIVRKPELPNFVLNNKAVFRNSNGFTDVKHINNFSAASYIGETTRHLQNKSKEQLESQLNFLPLP